MRCSACAKSFSVAWAQPSPGGSSAPGAFLVVTLSVLALSGLLLALDFDYAPWGCLAIAGFIAIQVLVAWSDCRGGGGACPKCGEKHPVRPWSF